MSGPSTLFFDTPAESNPIDQQRVIGKPISRIEGPLKVSGQAPYAYEYHLEAPNAAYGFVLGSAIAKGRIEHIDTREAESAPGVLLVMTHRNAPEQGLRKGWQNPQLIGDRIHSFDQSVALIVAETFEQARDAAHMLRITYQAESGGRFDIAAEKFNAVMPPEPGELYPPWDSSIGEFEKAFAAAPVQLDETYTTPAISHMAMEPYATLALWDADQLTVWTSHQLFSWALRDLPPTLLIPKENVRLISAYVGGGFGGKLYCQSDVVLAALGARMLGRPVKVALTRPQIMNNTYHGQATIQQVRLGAAPDGKLQAIGHDAWYGNQAEVGAPEPSAAQTRLLYAAGNRLTRHRHIPHDLPIGSAFRAPGERSGLLALETAMDELAEKLSLDPVELRVLNDTAYDPEVGPQRPFSTRKLAECMRTGAERFGWSQRNPHPGAMREGNWLVGMGMAAAIRKNELTSSSAQLTLTSECQLIVETATTDIGGGSYTVIAQTAAEMLGLELDQIMVRLGDTKMPMGAGSGGSWGGNCAASGVYAACLEMRRALAKNAGFDVEQTIFEHGMLRSGNRILSLRDLVKASPLTVSGGIEFGDLIKKYAQYSFGAHFCEVGVDAHTGETRIRRMLFVAAIGRVLNPKTARSQGLGGITNGIGAALMEECIVDTNQGYFVNHDLAGYHVPVHADIPDMEVIFLEELDAASSPLKAKGVGELSYCGSGAAVGNAIYNATGVRVREFPIKLDKLIDRLPFPHQP